VERALNLLRFHAQRTAQKLALHHRRALHTELSANHENSQSRCVHVCGHECQR
jgi:hypothetical protein